VGVFEGPLRQIVHALKYDDRRSVAIGLGALMKRSGAPVLDGASCVIPVPLHRNRRRARGFNQAALIAKHLGLPLLDALVRVRDTPSQAGLPSARRHANVRGAFALARAARGRQWTVVRRLGLPPADQMEMSIAGRCVVLVDDVSTTGATLDACARVLKEAGASEVRALIAARATARPDA
jgi:predicted amidophosphoribosyltransferase